jgi:hypothetical protein
MATLLTYTPVESIEGVSHLFFFRSWYLGEVGMMEFMLAVVKRTARSEECGGTGFTIKPAHPTLTALSHLQFNIPFAHILTSELSLFLHSLNINPAIDP